MRKKINEIFYSIQGEGYYTGTPAIFVRFSGCNLKCPFCDTSFDSYQEMNDDEIIDEIKQYPSKFIVLTGGEPGLQIDKQFIDKLKENGYYVAVETNGTIDLPDNIDWVTCSPKSTKNVNPKNINEIKVVFYNKNIVEKYNDWIGLKFLQPCSCKNTDEVIFYIKEHPDWRLSLQTQKIIGVQ